MELNYSLSIRRQAQKDLDALPRDVFERLRDAIRSLARNPRPPGCLKLTDREGWRIRIGDYRIIYEIDDVIRQVTVNRVRHRRDIYR